MIVSAVDSLSVKADRNCEDTFAQDRRLETSERELSISQINRATGIMGEAHQPRIVATELECPRQSRRARLIAKFLRSPGIQDAEYNSFNFIKP